MLNDNILLASRLVDLGAVLVALTSIIVTTRHTVIALKETIVRLTQIFEERSAALFKAIELLTGMTNRHDIEIARIKERCNLLTARGTNCAEDE